MSHPTSPTQMGPNRTGIGTSPIDSKELIEASQQIPVKAAVNGDGAWVELRTDLSRAAPPVGTMPPPASLKGAVKAAAEMLKGNAPAVLLDKLGERLAFERTGARLYEALIAKWEAADSASRRMSRPDLEEIRDDELRHLAWLQDAIQSLGADPTVITPCADVAATTSSGIVQVLSDVRVTFTQALDAIVAAELLDNEGWELLVQLAEELGHGEMAGRFRTALAEEQTHLRRVRDALADSVLGQGQQPTQSAPAPSAP